MGLLENASTSLVVSPAITNGTTTLDFVTPIPYPNRSGFTVSNGLVVISHSSTNMTLTFTAQLIRVNQAGTIVTSGTASASQNRQPPPRSARVRTAVAATGWESREAL